MKIKFLWRFSKFSSLFILYSFLCFFSNCAFTSKSKILDTSNLTPLDIQRKVSQNFQKLSNFEGKARVIIALPGQGYNGFSNVYINLPDSIFVKTEAILGIDVGALFLDRRNFSAYLPRENTLYYGESESLNIRDFLQIELDTEELLEVFTGLLQFSFNPDSKLLSDEGQYLISTPVEQGELKYWIDPKKYVVTKSQLIDIDGKIVLTKEFQRFRTKKGIVLPRIIRLTRPQARERITVYYTDQKINRTISAEKFKLKISKNARKIYWGDIKNPTIDRKLPENSNN